jgi:hypothetical protein
MADQEAADQQVQLWKIKRVSFFITNFDFNLGEKAA